MKPETFHQSATWLMGIIVGLALKEALTQIGPLLTTTDHARSEFWSVLLPCVRLGAFGITLIRFFFGMTVYFNQVYFDTETSGQYGTKLYLLDFLIGLTHFVIFFVWAGTLADVTHWDRGGLTHFEFGAFVVILYDLVWLVINIRWTTKKVIFPWVVINGITALAMAVVLLLDFDAVLREQIALCLLIVVGLIDISGLAIKRNLFAEFFIGTFKSVTT